MTDAYWHLIDTLTANAAGHLLEHPWLSQGAIAVTLAAGCYVSVAAPSWARSVCSDRSLRRVLHLCGLAAGGCLILTGLLYASLLGGLERAITFMPLMLVYYPASIVLSCAAIVFAAFQLFCALHVRRAPLLPAVVPALLGGWLFALSVPVYQFALLLGRNR